MNRALALLSEICFENVSSLSALSRAVDLSPATASRLLRSLCLHGYVERSEDGSYGTGPRMAQLGAMALSRESLVSAALPAMRRVAKETTESCYLTVLGAGETALHIAIVEGTQSVRHVSWVGRTIPITGTAAGLILESNNCGSSYVVVADGVEPDVTSIAAPVIAGDRVVAALSCLVPDYRLQDATRAGEIGATLSCEGAQIFTTQMTTIDTKEG